MTCYRSTVRDLYGYAGLLAGTDRAVAEDIVRDTYMSLLARAQRGDVSVVGYGYLRRSVRHRWIDSWRAEGREQPRMAAADTAPATPKEALDDVPVRLLAELPVRARTVMVLRYVEDMPVTAIAEALGTTDRAVESVMSRALHRMRRESLTTGRWIREHFGPEVRPRPDFARAGSRDRGSLAGRAHRHEGSTTVERVRRLGGNARRWRPSRRRRRPQCRSPAGDGGRGLSPRPSSSPWGPARCTWRRAAMALQPRPPPPCLTRPRSRSTRPPAAHRRCPAIRPRPRLHLRRVWHSTTRSSSRRAYRRTGGAPAGRCSRPGPRGPSVRCSRSPS